MVGSVCLDVRLHAVMACCLCAHMLPQILNIKAGYKEMLRLKSEITTCCLGPSVVGWCPVQMHTFFVARDP